MRRLMSTSKKIVAIATSAMATKPATPGVTVLGSKSGGVEGSIGFGPMPIESRLAARVLTITGCSRASETMLPAERTLTSALYAWGQG